MSGRLLALGVSSLALFLGSALAAGPSKRDLADAHAYYRAAQSFSSTLDSAIGAVPGRIDRQVGSCPASFSGASQAQVEEAKGAASDLEIFRAIMPRYATFARTLSGRRAQQPALRKLAAAVLVVNGEIQRFTHVHDTICTLGSEWQSQSWSEGFTDTWMQDLDLEAGADRTILDAAEKRAVATRTQLLRLGLTAKQADELVGAASLS